MLFVTSIVTGIHKHALEKFPQKSRRFTLVDAAAGAALGAAAGAGAAGENASKSDQNKPPSPALGAAGLMALTAGAGAAAAFPGAPAGALCQGAAAAGACQGAAATGAAAGAGAPNAEKSADQSAPANKLAFAGVPTAPLGVEGVDTAVNEAKSAKSFTGDTADPPPLAGGVAAAGAAAGSELKPNKSSNPAVAGGTLLAPCTGSSSRRSTAGPAGAALGATPFDFAAPDDRRSRCSGAGLPADLLGEAASP
mmetsp:Transcript_38024/g.70739  ORF Transcript_38024/g.70739 Transcript_38024/m.70739 type:complete len:252 (-) Transcript_38024:326-1081(-)